MVSPRDILNRARWSDANLHTLSVHVVHRGAPGDRRVVSGARIAGVHAAGIELIPETEHVDGSFLPYHRFLEIVGPEGEPLWPRRRVSPGAPVVEPVGDDVVSEPQGTVIDDDIQVLLSRDGGVLRLDGSAGEGGGQILRTSLSLSMLTGVPFVLENIRAGRRKPGLMRQHLTAVRAAATLCGAELQGDELRSTRLEFRPGTLTGGEHVFDIGSAGSVAMVLQTIALPLAMAKEPSTIVLRGGTHVPFSPPVPFLIEAWLPLMQRAGARIELELREVGFNPAGGGELVLHALPSPALLPLHLEPRSEPSRVSLEAIVAELPEGIARRELAAAAERLTGTSVRLVSGTVRSAGPGNAVWLTARDASGTCNLFSAIGEAGVSAERVGARVADAYLRWHASGAGVDEFLADQLLLPMAVAGGGSFSCNEWSLHARTHARVLSAFLPIRIRATQREGQVCCLVDG